MEFAPLDVPLTRRRQTFATFIYSSMMPLTQSFFLILCFFPMLWPLIFAYFIFMYFDNAAEKGGRINHWVKNWTIWTWLAEFFPSKLIVEEELDPKETYIFGYHPHGIISTGAFINFATNGTKLSEKLPGLNIRLCTLASNFFMPIYRELLLALGIISVSKKAILNVLKSGKGNSCVIVVGGAQESLSANENNLDLVLKKRFGFVSLAIKTGSNLVPVFGFGENQILDTVIPEPDSYIHKLQIKMKQALGFTMPIFHGRGIFTYNYGIMPKRVPLTIVVGKAIKVKQVDNPSNELVAEVHQQYMDALLDLYNRNKALYSPIPSPPEMCFI
ncbi:diacylglycerol acyltransferase [Neoconidiobolus thromboides FSU 785]|nr:diacylglycerol acyltransferase [Neoconidiobolus thromboides FSU 785]